MARNQVSNCAAFFVITGDKNKADLIKCGMVMESFLLDALDRNIAIHPMSQMLEENSYDVEIVSSLSMGSAVPDYKSGTG